MDIVTYLKQEIEWFKQFSDEDIEDYLILNEKKINSTLTYYYNEQGFGIPDIKSILEYKKEGKTLPEGMNILVKNIIKNFRNENQLHDYIERNADIINYEIKSVVDNNLEMKKLFLLLKGMVPNLQGVGEVVRMINEDVIEVENDKKKVLSKFNQYVTNICREDLVNEMGRANLQDILSLVNAKNLYNKLKNEAMVYLSFLNNHPHVKQELLEWERSGKKKVSAEYFIGGDGSIIENGQIKNISKKLLQLINMAEAKSAIYKISKNKNINEYALKIKELNDLIKTSSPYKEIYQYATVHVGGEVMIKDDFNSQKSKVIEKVRLAKKIEKNNVKKYI